MLARLPLGSLLKPFEERFELGIEGGADGWTEVLADLKTSEARRRMRMGAGVWVS